MFKRKIQFFTFQILTQNLTYQNHQIIKSNHIHIHMIKINQSPTFNSFKQQEPILSQIEIDIMFSLISNIRPEISSNKTMPITIIFSVKFIF